MRQKLVIWGASSHALVVADAIRSRGDYEIVGFLDDIHPERAGERFCGAQILGGKEQLTVLRRQDVNNLIFGLGDGQARLELSGLAREKGFQLATAVHSKAFVAADVSVGPGTLLVAGAVVNPAATVGENVIVNTCASVEHECVIEDGVHISAGVHLGGRVLVRRAAVVEIGATVASGICIGAGAIIGAGSVVLSDIPDFVLAYGVPAKVIRKIETDD
jgi:UDP-N-acetylbacillosamine N-acetyltransferase